MPINIKIEGVDELIKKASEERYRGLVSTGMRMSAEHVKGKASAYPAVSRRAQPARTAKQRRFLWAVGPLKYSRTKTLGRNWLTRLLGAFHAEVFNRTSYGPLVQGAGSQAHYHVVTGWSTDKAIAAAEAGAVNQILAAQLARLF